MPTLAHPSFAESSASLCAACLAVARGQAGYLAFHYLIVNPWVPVEVLRATVAAFPEAASIAFASARLLKAETFARRQLPHAFVESGPPPRHGVAQHFREQLISSAPATRTESRIMDGIAARRLSAPSYEMPLSHLARHNVLSGMDVLLQAGADPHREVVRLLQEKFSVDGCSVP